MQFKRGHEYKTPLVIGGAHHKMCIRDGDERTARFAHVRKQGASIRIGEDSLAGTRGFSFPWQKTSEVRRLGAYAPEQRARNMESRLGERINYSALPIPFTNRDNCESEISHAATGRRLSSQSGWFYAAVAFTPLAIDYTVRELRNYYSRD